MPLFRRERVVAVGGPGPSPPTEEAGYWANLPCVREFMSHVQWGDGASRVPGTIMLFAEGGFWKAWVHDRDAAQGAFLSARTLAALMEEVEEALGTGKGDWRPDKAKGRKGG